MATFALHAPESLEEASALLARYDGEARPIAGGTALVLMLRNALIAPSALVRLDRIPGLNQITAENGLLRLGASATLREVADSALVRERVPVLAEACNLVGNVRVRNAATMGGNVCEADYASDPPGVLFALDARVRAVGRNGEREIPVAELIRDFYETSLAPDEVVAEVLIPIPSPETRAVYLKYLTRSSEDRPCVGATGLVRTDTDGKLTDVRAAVGGIAGRPLRLPEVERQAQGQPASEAVFREIGDAYAAAADPIADVRGSASYRKRMVSVFVRRALQAAAQGESGARKC
jgi:aerobic carbon-monoxide dehydrogenase medium subunit